MVQKDYKALLGFTDQWFSLGILTEDQLRQHGNTYETSDDKFGEHYRYRAFCSYLQVHRPLPASIAEALYELGESDPDPSMGGAMMADIIRLIECPASVSAKALGSDRMHLVKVAKRQGLLSELRRIPLDADLFDRCVEDGDSVIQRYLLDEFGLSPMQLQTLAERGINRAVRNIASSKSKRGAQSS